MGRKKGNSTGELIRQLLLVKPPLGRGKIAKLAHVSYQRVRNVEEMVAGEKVAEITRGPKGPTPQWDFCIATESGMRLEVRLWEERPIRLK